MHAFPLQHRHDAFTILTSTSRSQAAVMVLAPGDTSGPVSPTEHPQADQWVYVIDGEGEAVPAHGPHLALAAGTLLLIPAGQDHQIRNTGRRPLRTLNVYAPLAYDRQGEPVVRPS